MGRTTTLHNGFQNELPRKPIRRSSVAFIRYSSPVSKTSQAVEKVVLRLVGSPKQKLNTCKTRLKHYKAEF
jgi:hypothetical protein